MSHTRTKLMRYREEETDVKIYEVDGIPLARPTIFGYCKEDTSGSCQRCPHKYKGFEFCWMLPEE